MANKFLPIILGLLLIVQGLNAAPNKSSEELNSKEAMEIKAFLERLKLALITLEEFAEILEELSVKGPKILKEVLNDPKVLEVKTETMETYLKEIRDYLEKTEKVNKNEEKDEAFDLFDQFTDIADKFDSEKQKDLTSEAQIIEKSLKEHGLDEIEVSMRNHLQEFLKKFKAEAEEYLKGLTSKEIVEEQSFKEWFEKLKAEDDMEKQIDLLDNFLDSEEDDKSK